MSESQMRRAFAAFSEVSPAIARVARVDDLLGLLVRQATALVGVDRCSIYLRDEQQDLFRGRVGYSRGQPLGEEIGRSLAGIPADGVTREVVRTRQPVVVANARQDSRMVRSAVRHWKIRSIAEVPMVFNGEVIGLMMLDDVDSQHRFSEQEVELAACFADLAALAVTQTRERLDLRSRLDAAGRQLGALRRATAVDDRLCDLVVEGRPLQDLTASLAEMLGKPCAVFDPEGRRVAAALPEGAGESAVPRLLEPEVAARPEVRKALLEGDPDRAFVVGPLPFAGVMRRHIVAPVMLGSELWGRLVVMEHSAGFSGGDVVAARRAATAIALQASAERKAVEADWSAGSSLAAELLSGGSDVEIARRRADRLGVRLEARRAVMLIAPRSGEEEDAPDFRAVAAAFRHEAPELTVHVTAVAAAVAALVAVPDSADGDAFLAAHQPAFEAVRSALQPAEQLVAGVSAVRSGRDGYRVAYREARQVVDCIRRFSPAEGPKLFTAAELGVGGLLLSSADPEAVAGFAEETVGDLAREHSKADLLTTLVSFFDSMGSIRGTAAALDVHENTIRYRLSRIEELTGLAVMHDPDAQLRVRLSLLVLLLQGRLPGGMRPPAPIAEPPRLQVLDAV